MDFGDIFGMEGAVEGVDINRTHASPAGALDIVDRMIAHIHAVMAAHAHAGGGPAEDLGIRLVQILVARDHAEIHKRAQGADIQLSITFPSLSFGILFKSRVVTWNISPAPSQSLAVMSGV